MRTCEMIEDGVKCEGKHKAKGMCKKQSASAKHGDPLVVERVARSVEKCAPLRKWPHTG